MEFTSFYPPFSHYSTISKIWYVIAGGEWHPVKRQYSWQELESMWKRLDYSTPQPKQKVKKQIEKFQVEGSKGNSYEIVNDNGNWSCSCPAHGFSRGRDCKHIKQIKQL